ncbi:hypothetical protein [Niallia nealsonii]|uniref:Uncharacterized protein n=1 Tax=Niallia nealsonii TaxID=115979 RepID=A0A2N0YWU3_9BACI|nr:hypothetical protein [Niallia nealsonii]PKG21726.1 hypothetical protein CWS01_21035 [Niallia nealsonii]
MSYIITFLVSLIEWAGLISFPLILLGYKYNYYIKNIIIQSACMSFISILLHLTSMSVPVIVGLQIIILIFLFKIGLKTKNLEAIALTSIGYGFYLFLQLLVIELLTSFLQGSYLKLYQMSNFTVFVPMITISILLISCFVLYKNKLQISELRYQLKADHIEKKTKRIIQILFAMTYIFIVLGATVLMADKQVKYSFILLSIVVLFAMMLCYLIFHSQLQKEQLLFAKKYYLDQEQQVAAFVEKLKQNYVMHFRTIEKLNHAGSSDIIADYIDTHELQQMNMIWKNKNLRKGIEALDPLLYSFLVNKRKLADLLGVEMNVNSHISSEEFASLGQIRNISLIIDDLMLTLYDMKQNEKKLISIELDISDTKFIYKIEANLTIDPNNMELGLFDALIKLRQNRATVDMELDPVNILVKIPIL